MTPLTKASDAIQEVTDTSAHLARFSHLNANLNGDTQKIEKASQIVSKLLSDKTQETQAQVLQDLNTTDPTFLQTYPEKYQILPLANPFIYSLYKDLQGAKTSSCSISNLGFNGPTLLVNLSRDNGHSPLTWTKHLVVKWAPKSEFYSSQSIGRLLSSLPNSYYCSVPSSYFLDLRNSQCLHIDGSSETIPSEIHRKLQRNFQKIAEYNRCIPSDENSIMVSKKVRGSNLRDFILYHYHLLNQNQKEFLFQQLGFLSFFDTIVGNLDRLVQIEKDFSGFVVGARAPANLGNIMVKLPNKESSSPKIYAIDNGIHVNPTDLSKYKEFNQKFAKNPHKTPILARNITNSIKASFTQPNSPFYHPLPPEDSENSEVHLSDSFIGKMLLADSSEPSAEVTTSTNLRTFTNDMDSFGYKQIDKGIAKGVTALKTSNLQPVSLAESSLQDRTLQERIQNFKKELEK